MAPPPKQPPTTAVQRVHAYVKEAVMSGEFAEGTMLSEGQVAEALAVSRTPVREAFVQLETLGYLRLYPKRGALVVPVSREDILYVVDTRWVVERHAVERAVERRDDAVLAAMRASLANQRERIDAGDLDGFADADRDFHRALVQATDNPILTDLYDSLRDRQRRMTRGMVRGDTARAEDVLTEHQALYDAIAAADLDGTLTLLRSHLDGSIGTLLG